MKKVFWSYCSIILLFSCTASQDKMQKEKAERISDSINQINYKINERLLEAREGCEKFRLKFNIDSIERVIRELSDKDPGEGLKIVQSFNDIVSRMADSIQAIENETANKQKEIVYKELKEDVQRLFNSLMSFKNTREFKEYGFDVGSKYDYWLVEVGRLKSSEAANLFLSNCGFVVGDLEMLGLEYVSSKGRETEYSRYTSKMIRDGLKGIKNYE